VKQLNPFPLIAMLVVILLLIYWIS